MDSLEADLETQAAILDGQHYLTTPERKQLDATVQRLSETYTDIYSTNWPFRYSEKDLDRLSEIRETVQSISKRVRSYNAEFVEQELERYAHLVTDVESVGSIASGEGHALHTIEEMTSI
ncbi:hypothetical protein EL22_28850 [Halostagnicola sp. A56]|nr:hypothetical protein EL22_28850 [Halostagnicola sp. A56]